MSNLRNYDDVVAVIKNQVYCRHVSWDDLIDISVLNAGARDCSADAIAAWFILDYKHPGLHLTIEDVQILLDIGTIKSVEMGEMTVIDLSAGKEVTICMA